MKRFLLLLLGYVVSPFIYAQVSSVIFENGDALINYPQLTILENRGVVKQMPPVDAQKLLAEDKQRYENHEKSQVPFRFGYGFDVNYTLEEGIWDYRDDIKIWNLRISSPGAYSINLIFEQMHLSKDAILYIFNPNGTMVYGPVTAAQNIDHENNELFLTDLVAGDEIVVQLNEPLDAKEQSYLKISRVVHAYVDIFSSQSRGAAPCQKDVACFSNYSNESDAIVFILLSNGYEQCSGCLLNNTAQDFRPFLLTAFHCIDTNKDGSLSSSEITNAQNALFKYYLHGEVQMFFIIPIQLTTS